MRPVPPSSRAALAAVLVAGALALATGVSRGDDKPTLDLAYYTTRVAPILTSACAECHADPRRKVGRFRLRPRPPRTPSSRDHEKNFAVVSGFVDPGDPSRSPLLLKALGPKEGGVEHQGGSRVRYGSLEYRTLVDFIDGARTDAAAAPAAPHAGLPSVGPDGLLLEAEDLALGGGVAPIEDAAASGGRAVSPGPEGGVVTFRVHVPGAGPYELLCTARGPGEIRVVLDGHARGAVVCTSATFGEAGPSELLDAGAPVTASRGDVRFEGGHARLDGRPDAPAAFVVPVEVEHRRLEAEIALPSEEEGLDDVLLLFDAEDEANAPFVALVDGGRRLAMGLLEGGRQRVLETATLEPRAGAGDHVLAVDLLDGLAIGRLDGRPLAHLHVDRALGLGPFGVLSHGRVVVVRLRATAQYTVYESDLSEGPVLELTEGDHTFRLTLPPGGPLLDRVRLRPR